MYFICDKVVILKRPFTSEHRILSRSRRDPGEMPELAEGARLEIVCSAKSGTEGSNPSLSARKFAGQILPTADTPVAFQGSPFRYKPELQVKVILPRKNL
jgi:hypothetical protein